MDCKRMQCKDEAWDDSWQRSVVAYYGQGTVLSGSIKDGRHFTWWMSFTRKFTRRNFLNGLMYGYMNYTLMCTQTRTHTNTHSQYYVKLFTAYVVAHPLLIWRWLCWASDLSQTGVLRRLWNQPSRMMDANWKIKHLLRKFRTIMCMSCKYNNCNEQRRVKCNVGFWRNRMWKFGGRYHINFILNMMINPYIVHSPINALFIKFEKV